MDNPDTPTPAPESQSLTLDQIKTILEGFRGEIKTELAQQVNGLAAKLNGRIETVKGEADANIAKLASTLTPPTEPTETPPETEKKDTSAEQDPVTKLQAALSRQARETAKRIQEMESKMQEAERQNQRLQAVQEFSRTVGDRFIDTEALLTIAESRGILRQEGTQFQVVAGKDEYTGEALIKPVSEGIDALVAAAPYLEKPRPGNGTGATAGEPVPPSTPKYQDPQAIMNAIMQGKAAEVINEIKS